MARNSVVVLSPHLDDAVVSFGAAIHVMSKFVTVTIRSVFAASSSNGLNLGDWGDPAERRLEDVQACSRLGADHSHGLFEEAMLRIDRWGRSIYSQETVMSPPAPGDLFPRKLAYELLGSNTDDSTVLVAPLGRSAHVDHQLVRLAAELVAPHQIIFYDDFPFFAPSCGIQAPADGLTEYSLEADPTSLDVKLRAIAEYESQIAPLFQNADQMARLVREYHQARRGERFWVRGMSRGGLSDVGLGAAEIIG